MWGEGGADLAFTPECRSRYKGLSNQIQKNRQPKEEERPVYVISEIFVLAPRQGHTNHHTS